MEAASEQEPWLEPRQAHGGDGAVLTYTSSGTSGLAVLSPLAHGTTIAALEHTVVQRPFLRALGSGHQLVLYDQRGAGDSAEAGPPASWEQRARDLWAVADAAGVERAVLYGVFDAGHTIAHAAALQPDRVLGLIFNRVPVCFGATCAGGVSSAELTRWLSHDPAAPHAGALAMMEAIGIASHDAEVLVAGWERALLAENASAQAELLRNADLRALLPSLDLPALVLAPARRPLLTGWGHALAEPLPGARLVAAENGGETLGALHAFLAVLSGAAGRRASRIAADLTGTLRESTSSVRALRRIVVPVDPTVASGRAVELACRLGEAQDAQIILVHVLAVPRALPLDHPLPETQRRAVRALALGEAIAAEHGLRCSTRLLPGRVVAECILKLAREERADLIVMAEAGAAGSGREEISRTIQDVVRRAPCEVIIDDPGPVRFAGAAGAVLQEAAR
jgi:nucleotide-binding universal stress UspA family protein/pimeloyl-ACP methyl ester carboxylesterase